MILTSIRTRRVIAAVGATLVAAACGGDGGTEVSSEADGTMSATFQTGGSFEANKSLDATFDGDALVITGTDRNGRFVKLHLIGVRYNAANPDSVQSFTMYGQAAAQAGFAQYHESSNDSFSTTQTGGSGTIRVTRLTETRAVGTFTFTAVRSAITPGPPGTQDLFRRLMGGQFDVRLH